MLQSRRADSGSVGVDGCSGDSGGDRGRRYHRLLGLRLRGRLIVFSSLTHVGRVLYGVAKAGRYTTQRAAKAVARCRAVGRFIVVHAVRAVCATTCEL